VVHGGGGGLGGGGGGRSQGGKTSGGEPAGGNILGGKEVIYMKEVSRVSQYRTGYW